MIFFTKSIFLLLQWQGCEWVDLIVIGDFSFLNGCCHFENFPFLGNFRNAQIVIDRVKFRNFKVLTLVLVKKPIEILLKKFYTNDLKGTLWPSLAGRIRIGVSQFRFQIFGQATSRYMKWNLLCWGTFYWGRILNRYNESVRTGYKTCSKPTVE